MSPITAATWRSSWTTVAKARTSAYSRERADPRLHVAAALLGLRAPLAGDVGDHASISVRATAYGRAK